MRLVATRSSQRSPGPGSFGPPMPAFATSAARGPSSRATASNAASTGSWSRMSQEPTRTSGAPASSAARAVSSRRAGSRASSASAAVTREAQGDGPADAGARAGDDDGAWHRGAMVASVNRPGAGNGGVAGPTPRGRQSSCLPCCLAGSFSRTGHRWQRGLDLQHFFFGFLPTRPATLAAAGTPGVGPPNASARTGGDRPDVLAVGTRAHEAPPREHCVDAAAEAEPGRGLERREVARTISSRSASVGDRTPARGSRSAPRNEAHALREALRRAGHVARPIASRGRTTRVTSSPRGLSRGPVSTRARNP